MNTSCANCVHCERLPERVEGFDWRCKNATPKAHFMQGAGRVKRLTPRTDDGEPEPAPDYRMLLTHPNDATCEQFHPVESA